LGKALFRLEPELQFMTRPKPIEPRVLTRREQFVNELSRHGIDSSGCQLLADVVFEAFDEQPKSIVLEDFTLRHLHEWHDQAGIEGLLVLLIDWLQSECYSNPGWDTNQAIDRLFTKSMKRPIDWNLGLLRAGAVGLKDPYKIASTLVTRSLVRPIDCIRMGTISDSAEMGRCPPLSSSRTERKSHELGLDHAAFWIEVVGIKAFAGLTPRIAEFDDLELCNMLYGTLPSIRLWMSSQEWHETWFDRADKSFADIFRPIVDLLEVRFESSPENETLQSLWLRFAWMVYEADPSSCSAERRKKLLKAAHDDLGRLRPLLRKAATEGAAEEFRSRWANRHPSLFLIYRLGGLWQGTRVLLHAFRALNTPALAADLRYWPTLDRQAPPEPWSSIPTSLVSMFHNRAAAEQQADDDLSAFRAAFAEYCLERLKTRKARTTSDDLDFVEPSPIWRECFVRAIGELHVNPGGKGHRVLNWLSENDPDEDVRIAAKKVYVALRHGPSLPTRTSPRRAFIHAFWWISQAHLLALGVELDDDGAQRTREEEVRRTTEPADL
jgi:hypothetical protein